MIGLVLVDVIKSEIEVGENCLIFGMFATANRLNSFGSEMQIGVDLPE